MSKARLAAGCYFQTGDGTNAAGLSEIQSWAVGAGTPTSGAVTANTTIGFNAGIQPAATIPIGSLTFSQTSANLQTLLNACPSIGLNTAGLPNAVASGGPWPGTPLVVTYQNDLALRSIPLPTFTNNTLSPASTPAVTRTAVGAWAGEAYSNITELTTMPFPQVKRAKKEVTNFDSPNFTKEFIPEFIDPGDIKIDANYVGDASQDYRTGLIAKFNLGLIYTCRINIPNYQIGPGVFAMGHIESFKGFFTDAALAPSKVTDTLSFAATLGVTGAVTYLMPI